MVMALEGRQARTRTGAKDHTPLPHHTRTNLKGKLRWSTESPIEWQLLGNWNGATSKEIINAFLFKPSLFIMTQLS